MNTADNELLTRVGPGAQMGDLLRRYWIPALLSEELPRPGCPPKRVELLGEHLVAFRAGNGELGMVEDQCAHRLAALSLGRSEADGIRCAYHGWKYNAGGRCIDMPNEPATSRFREHIRITAYPVQERGDVIWVYMGTDEEPPPLPEFEWGMVSESQRYVSKRLQDCNFVQTIEGGIDASHASILHADTGVFDGRPDDYADNFSDLAPRFFVETTEYGLLVVAERTRPDSRKYVRITQLILPWYTLIAPTDFGVIGGHAFVPANDGQTWVWSLDYHPDRPLTHRELAHYRRGGDIHSEVHPETFVPVRNKDNNYLRDPYLQAMGSITGIVGIANQDAAVQESMGPITDRSKEHLGSSDAGVIVFRKRLLALARDGAKMEALPGLDPGTHRVRSVSLVLEPGQSWLEASKALRHADPSFYSAHMEVQ